MGWLQAAEQPALVDVMDDKRISHNAAALVDAVERGVLAREEAVFYTVRAKREEELKASRIALLDYIADLEERAGISRTRKYVKK